MDKGTAKKFVERHVKEGTYHYKIADVTLFPRHGETIARDMMRQWNEMFIRFHETFKQVYGAGQVPRTIECIVEGPVPEPTSISIGYVVDGVPDEARQFIPYLLYREAMTPRSGRWCAMFQGLRYRTPSKAKARRLTRQYGGKVRRWRGRRPC